jgi:dipeptidyl aminopeptidase/acylaminoacyl peptidase
MYSKTKPEKRNRLQEHSMKSLFYPLFLLLITTGFAQESLEYQKPPQEILDLVDVELAPRVIFDSEYSMMITLQRDAFKSIEELSQPELRLAGLRINPKTSMGSRVTTYHTIKIKDLTKTDSKPREVTGLPEQAKLANFSMSPDEKKLAFTNTTSQGVDLWLVDLNKAVATQLTDLKINAAMGDVINWFENSKALLVKVIPEDKQALIDTKNAVPVGPIISTSDGKKAQNRTYQDLLKNRNDEHNFEQISRSEIHKVTLKGRSSVWLPSDMYRSVTFSPDGEYVMVNTIGKPFSYLVPYYRFPSKTTIYTDKAKAVALVSDVPLIEDLPKGFEASIDLPREFRWRNDKPATLVYVKALDGGDPSREVEHRDEVFQLEAPFSGQPTPLLKTINRFNGIIWGNEKLAIATDSWWNTRNTKSYVFDPSKPGAKVQTLYSRDYQDRYGDPGNFVLRKNKMGSLVLEIEKNQAFLIGDGYTEKGQFPFLDRLDLRSLKTTRVYTSTYTDKLESLYDYLVDEQRLIVEIESKNDYPNYFSRSLNDDQLTQLSHFPNPFEPIASVYKEVISYPREDGLELSGTLYLPLGYDRAKQEKMPMIMWAYPREYKDKSSAGQNTQNPNTFTYLWYGSPIYWVTQGYVVLADAAFPIVGEGDQEPNDSFRSQLVANAKAAIDAVDAMGYIDRGRIAVGGHSYGAFMVANLLSHSDLFAAGIARSGAYNRTLTPFGFQSEERSYWEAPEVYYTMSPFMHADKMKSPLLLIHGEADNNSGTYPMQSERYFNALKGLGATTRLVMLPKESHGYRAKESVLHVLWEQHEWLEKYVKGKPSN